MHFKFFCCVVVFFFFLLSLSKALIILACFEKRVLYHQTKSNMFFQEHLAIQRKTWNHLELSRKKPTDIWGCLEVEIFWHL